ncbi:hypothetical protein B0H10DRAFT_1949197 [Mycena sp. CBHHK59/15]|nr:hypothetical protein B0H10DRAFT_1949197 [Mycena sp. CBHHK59/15]
MPKAASTSVTRTRTPPKSHKKPATKSEPSVVDETQWRNTTIWKDSMARINKTNVVKQYKLSASDLEGLEVTKSETVVNVRGKNTIVPVYLYNERAVERVAWRKHGGPEGFELHLKKLRERYKKTHPGNEFQQPDAYRDPNGSVSIVQLSPSKILSDRRASTPRLLRLKEQFLSFNLTWLWDAGNEALEDDGEDDLLPSFTALRDVLDRAASLRDEATRDQVDVNECGFTGDHTYFWREVYMEELFKALIAVIKEHGLGEEGWKSARWEVYDKYSECIYRLTYDRGDGGWWDEAADWLRGSMDLNGPNYLTTRQDNKSEIGKRYNAMLPSQ